MAVTRQRRRDPQLLDERRKSHRHRGDRRHAATGAVIVSQLGGTVDGLDDAHDARARSCSQPGMMVAVDAHEAIDLAAAHARRRRRREGARVCPRASCAPARRRPATTSYWESGCVFVTLDAAGTNEIAGDAEFDVIDAVDRRPGTTTPRACSYLESWTPGRKALEVGNDHVNLIKFRDQSAGAGRRSTTTRRAATTRAAAGITTATYVDDAIEQPRRRDRRCGHRAQRRRLRDLGRRQTLGTRAVPVGAAEHADPRARPPARARAHVHGRPAIRRASTTAATRSRRARRR